MFAEPWSWFVGPCRNTTNSECAAFTLSLILVGQIVSVLKRARQRRMWQNLSASCYQPPDVLSARGMGFWPASDNSSDEIAANLQPFASATCESDRANRLRQHD